MGEIGSALRSLTPRQREVLGLAASGLTAAEIGERLRLPRARVNAYLKAAWGRIGGGGAGSAVERPMRADEGAEVGSLRQAFGLPQERFARLAGVSPRTVARWEASGARVTPEPAAADRLDLLTRIRDIGTETFGADGFRAFVRSRQPLLEGRRVIDVLESEGRDQVLDVLDGIGGGGPA
jgi:DNA-binding transcriptional regulator YiaG